LEFLHDFDWGNVEILDKEIHFNKIIISEMIHIKKQSYSLNLQHDTDSLHSIYFDIQITYEPSNYLYHCVIIISEG